MPCRAEDTSRNRFCFGKIIKFILIVYASLEFLLGLLRNFFGHRSPIREPYPGRTGHRQMVNTKNSAFQKSMVKKLSFDGSGPPQKMCPKSGQKMVKKWSQPRPGTIKTPLKHH